MPVDAAQAQRICARLTSENLVLEPLLGAHADDLFDAMQHPAIYEWISGPPPSTPDRLRDHWARNESRVSPDGNEVWLAWAIRLQDGAFIGKCDIDLNAENAATNLGYLLFPAFWGKGYATQVVGALVKQLDRFDVKRARATVTVGNLASERVLEKNGFVRMRILPAHDVIRGIPMDDTEFIRRKP